MRNRFLKKVIILFLTFLTIFTIPLFQSDISANELSWGIFPKDKKEKKEDTKISPHLNSVLKQMQEMGVTRNNIGEMNTSELSTSTVKIDETGNVQIYIYLDHVSDGNISTLEELGVKIEIVNKKHAIIQGWSPIFHLEDIAALDFVIKITPPDYGEQRTGSVKTEGDTIMRSDEVRDILGFDGSSVLVGVISDGVDNAHEAQSTGDLPESISINPALPGGGDEGTAMLEIIHDIAPGAALAFTGGSTGIPTSLEFIQGINFFLNLGVDIIVDDVGFLLQPFFEDGFVALEAKAAVEQGIVFISAAGNGAERHYQAMYVDNNPAVDENLFSDLSIDNLHDFGIAAGGNSKLEMHTGILPGGTARIVLQWNDPFGASSNDYDLFVIPETLNFQCVPEVFVVNGLFVCGSVNPQEGNHDPLETVIITNTSPTDPLSVFIIIDRFSGEARVLEMIISPTGLFLEFNVTEDSIFGHPAVKEVIAVGAVPASSPNTIQPFSSRGPSTVYFPFFEQRPKPDVVATDGVSITGAGGFPSPFFGTSASAPHVAGVVALMLHANPSLTPTQVLEVLRNTAVDLGIPGFNFTYGAGRVDAFEAVQLVAQGEPDPIEPMPIVGNGSSGCSISGNVMFIPNSFLSNASILILLPFLVATLRRRILRHK